MTTHTVDQAREGLARFGSPEALRARDMLDEAISLSSEDRIRTTELQAYALRECLETVPRVFGIPKQIVDLRTPLRDLIRELESDYSIDEIDPGAEADATAAAARAINPEVVKEAVDAVARSEVERRERVAAAMSSLVGEQVDTAEMERFSNRWVSTVERLNSILHGDGHDSSELPNLLATAVDLVATLAGPMSSKLDDMDGLLQQTSPQAQDVDKLLDLVADPRLAVYFFSRCDNPAWAEQLFERGVFDPPRQGAWPQSTYIARVSVDAEPVALDVARTLARTDHPIAASTAIHIGARIGKPGLPVIRLVLSRSNYPTGQFVGRDLSELVELWESAGLVEELLEIVDVVVEPVADDLNQITWKLDPFDHGQFLLGVTAAADCDTGLGLLKILRFKLERATRLDPSVVRILEMRGVSLKNLSVSNAPHDRFDALVGAMWDVLNMLAEQCGIECEAVASVLRPVEMGVAQRLWFDYLSAEGSRCPEAMLVEEAASAMQNAPNPESLALAELVWQTTNEDKRRELVASLGEPPAPGEIRSDGLPQARQIELYRQAQWLAGLPVGELSDEWSAATEAFRKAFGDIEPVRAPIVAGEFVAYESPLTAAEIADLGPDSFVEWLALRPHSNND